MTNKRRPGGQLCCESTDCGRSRDDGHSFGTRRSEMACFHNENHSADRCTVHRAGTERRNFQNKFCRLLKAFLVTCQMLFCRLQMGGVMSPSIHMTTSSPKKFQLV